MKSGDDFDPTPPGSKSVPSPDPKSVPRPHPKPAPPSGSQPSHTLAGTGDAAAIGALVVAFAVMARWSELVLRLPEGSYRSPVVSLQIGRELLFTLPGLVGLVPIVWVLAVRRRFLWVRWREISGSDGVRPLVLAMLVWATWAAITLDHNLFYGHSYDVDRLLLVVLAAAAVWRPVFVVPHVFLFIAIEHQFDHPFGRQIFARGILEDLLLLFAAALLVNAVLKRKETRTYLFVACALLASYYWYPGWVKLVRGWVGYGQLYLGGYASYANGWLASWPVERMEWLLGLGAKVDWPGRIVTLGSELAAVLFFAHRKIPRILLGVWAVLHVGVWVFSGVSFLVWIAVDVAFLVVMVRRGDVLAGMFSPAHALAGAVLILASPLWVRPPPVGWFDTPLVYTYRYVATDDSGSSGAFPADATPLGEGWCARDFPFLLERPSLLVRYGKTNDRALAEEIRRLDGSLAQLEALELARGQVYFDADQAATLDRYLGTIAMRWNQRGSARHALAPVAPPRTCLSPRSEPEPVLERGRAIERIEVIHVTFMFDGQHFREIRRVPVREIDVPS